MRKYEDEHRSVCQRRNVACHRRATEWTLLMIWLLLLYTLFICLLYISASAITKGHLPLRHYRLHINVVTPPTIEGMDRDL
jgi:hypothetical protein